MTKVLSTLILTSLFAVLLVPVVAFAAPCPSCTTITVQCECGANVLPAGGLQVCYNSTVYSTLAGCPGTGSTTGGGSITTVEGLIAKLNQISNWVFNILLIIAGIFLIVAGYFFVTGGGEPEKVNKARQMLINALIGVAIAVAAKGLVALVQNIVQ
jgi:hypothetical protein